MVAYSNLCVYAAMAFLTLAMFSFTASFAAPRGRSERVRPEARAKVAAGVPASPGAAGPLPQPPEALAGGPADGPVSTGAAAELPAGRRAANIGMALLWLSLGFLVVALFLRAAWAGRAPWGNMYEFSLASAVAILGVYLVASLRRDLRALGLPISIMVLLTLGVAVVLLYNDSPQLVPALNSYWLVIHVAAAVVCGGAFTVGAAATVLYLIRLRAEERDQGEVELSGWVARLPDSATLDGVAYRANAFVFPLWTFTIIAGAIWAEEAWGRYWGWDPKETWAFVTWVLYAGYLHARSTAGWRGRRAAVLGLIGFAAFLINFFGVNLFASGLHSYSGV